MTTEPTSGRLYSLTTILLLVLAISGCASRDDTMQKWTPSDLNGRRLSLVDEQEVENLAFFPGGYVQITIGSKSAVAGPEGRWEIDSKGVLVIRDMDGSVEARFKKLHETNGKIMVERCGYVFCSKREYRVK